MSAKQIALLPAALALSLSLSSPADPWDPNDDTASGTTNVLVPSATSQTQSTHFLDGLDTEDWYKVSLNAGTTYRFEAVGGSGSDDTEAELYQGTSGPLVALNADDGQAGVFNFMIVYTPNVSGDYFLKVYEWGGGAAEYDLSYGTVSDAWEPADNSTPGALLRPIDEMAHSEGPHTLTDVDAADWYCFNLNAGNTYRLETTGNWDTYGQLFSDPAGTAEVAADDSSGDLSSGDNFRIDYNPSSSGGYYLSIVQTNNPLEYAKYEFRYRLIEDEWDPGDDNGPGSTILSPIDETLRTHGPHALSETDPYDWFKMHLTAGQTYRIESSGESDTEAYLYSDSSGTVQVEYNDDFQPLVDSNFQIVYTPDSTGNYYLRVNHSNIGNDAIYALKYGIENDMDGDGMYDAWEIAFLGGTNALPGAHGDADPLSNLEEFIAGTDPTNSASFFAVTNWSVGSFVVGWPSVADREYRVYWAESLTNDFTQISPVIDHPQNSYTDTTHNAESSGFYKVDVRLK